MKLTKLYRLKLDTRNHFKTLFICRLGNSLECIVTNDKECRSIARADDVNLASEYPTLGNFYYADSVREFLHSEREAITVKIKKGKSMSFVYIPKPLFWGIRLALIKIIDK